jgi:hypothetical protein
VGFPCCVCVESTAGDIYVACYGFSTFPENICIGIIILCVNYIIEFIQNFYY